MTDPHEPDLGAALARETPLDGFLDELEAPAPVPVRRHGRRDAAAMAASLVVDGRRAAPPAGRTGAGVAAQARALRAD